VPKSLHGYRSIRATSRRKSGAYSGLLRVGVGVIVAFLAAPRPISSQSEPKDPIEGSLLPATTGEPLTITPLDTKSIDCIVADWRPIPTRPVLTLICPPSTVFAPLRVLIKFSWMKTQDVPANHEHILAPAGSPTKIRTNKTAVQVWLQVDEKGEGKPQSTWIGFNAVVDVALLRGRAK
jgi:hypothetical protein